MASIKSAICLVVDRLHAGMLGPYGNTWIRTPGFDRLASEGFVLDQAFADSTRLESLYRAYWQGLPALWPAERAGPSLVQLLSEASFATTLLTDERAVAELPGAADFQERAVLDVGAAAETASDESQTGIGRFFAAASAWLESAREPFFLWLHSRGMGGSWDAPLGFRNQYVDEEDPVPPDSSAVPCYRLPEDFDPDEVLGVTHAYAGQVSLLDRCLAALLDQLHASGLADNTLVMLLGARGFPLGEHGHIGPWDEALYNETVQIPWLARFPGEFAKLGRTQALVEPADLPRTLLDWWGTGLERWSSGGQSLLPIIEGEKASLRDHIYLVGGSKERAIRTPGWHLKLASGDADARVELYAKPSDRWEVNEVANRCSEIAAGLKTALLAIEARGPSADASSLTEELVSEMD